MTSDRYTPNDDVTSSHEADAVASGSDPDTGLLDPRNDDTPDAADDEAIEDVSVVESPTLEEDIKQADQQQES